MSSLQSPDYSRRQSHIRHYQIDLRSSKRGTNYGMNEDILNLVGNQPKKQSPLKMKTSRAPRESKNCLALFEQAVTETTPRLIERKNQSIITPIVKIRKQASIEAEQSSNYVRFKFASQRKQSKDLDLKQSQLKINGQVQAILQKINSKDCYGDVQNEKKEGQINLFKNTIINGSKLDQKHLKMQVQPRSEDEIQQINSLRKKYERFIPQNDSHQAFGSKDLSDNYGVITDEDMQRIKKSKYFKSKIAKINTKIQDGLMGQKVKQSMNSKVQLTDQSIQRESLYQDVTLNQSTLSRCGTLANQTLVDSFNCPSLDGLKQESKEFQMKGIRAHNNQNQQNQDQPQNLLTEKSINTFQSSSLKAGSQLPQMIRNLGATDMSGQLDSLCQSTEQFNTPSGVKSVIFQEKDQDINESMNLTDAIKKPFQRIDQRYQREFKFNDPKKFMNLTNGQYSRSNVPLVSGQKSYAKKQSQFSQYLKSEIDNITSIRNSMPLEDQSDTVWNDQVSSPNILNKQYGSNSQYGAYTKDSKSISISQNDEYIKPMKQNYDFSTSKRASQPGPSRNLNDLNHVQDKMSFASQVASLRIQNQISQKEILAQMQKNFLIEDSQDVNLKQITNRSIQSQPEIDLAKVLICQMGSKVNRKSYRESMDLLMSAKRMKEHEANINTCDQAQSIDQYSNSNKEMTSQSIISYQSKVDVSKKNQAYLKNHLDTNKQNDHFILDE